ncbi:hypothetical protein HGRIS_003233 [Hohenbuehelia grisea]|uniref:Uncharacterized protein n=1 Tax=Hohenbuehelia grisea TaxID=104357 RepID=A0ABR3JNK9_9AGAR
MPFNNSARRSIVLVPHPPCHRRTRRRSTPFTNSSRLYQERGSLDLELEISAKGVANGKDDVKAAHTHTRTHRPFPLPQHHGYARTYAHIIPHPSRPGKRQRSHHLRAICPSIACPDARPYPLVDLTSTSQELKPKPPLTLTRIRKPIYGLTIRKEVFKTRHLRYDMFGHIHVQLTPTTSHHPSAHVPNVLWKPVFSTHIAHPRHVPAQSGCAPVACSAMPALPSTPLPRHPLHAFTVTNGSNIRLSSSLANRLATRWRTCRRSARGATTDVYADARRVDEAARFEAGVAGEACHRHPHFHPQRHHHLLHH